MAYNPGLLAYFFFEILWVLLWFGCALAIIIKTELEHNLYNIIAIIVAPLHLFVLAAVLYAISKEAERIGAVAGLVFAVMVDTVLMLHIGLHLKDTEAELRWTFILNAVVAAVGLFISVYAIVWYTCMHTVYKKHPLGRKRQTYQQPLLPPANGEN
jgi:phosphotransferase system  glucose/maltose/N-acetylglucosamine-specific IIC component